MTYKYSKKNAVGVDLGGTNIGVGLVDKNGKVLKNKIELTKKEFGPKGVISQMIKMAKDVFPKNGAVLGIGIGSPGPLDLKRGLVISTPNLPGWKRVDILTPFKKEFKVPIFLNNDANAAALAEWKFGAGCGTKNMIYLTISTGIGGGIIINGKLYVGFGNAGEIGHTIIDLKSKYRCGCGIYGSLEALASGTGIAKQFQQKLKIEGTPTPLNKITAKEVFSMAKKGDKKAKKIVNEALAALGTGLLNCIHIFDPEVIVLGGSLATKNKGTVFPFVREFVRKRAMPVLKDNIKILPAKLGKDAGIVGAAVLVFEGLKNKNKT